MYRGHYAIRVLLAFGLLFLGVPAWKHAHPGGDQPHGHLHEHDLHEHDLHEHDLHEHEGAGESQWHLHVALFGVEFTLPAEPDNDDADAGELSYLIAAPATLTVAQASVSLVPSAVSLNTARPLQLLPHFRPKPASAAPLCDAARHERSGVLLV